MSTGPSAPASLEDALPEGVSLNQALEWFTTHQQGQQLLLGSIAFLVWDWIITFEEEREFIWQRNPWTITKGLFFINRYFPIVQSVARFWSYSHERDPNLSTLACGPILDLAAYGSVLSVAIVEIVLMLRLWALYARNKIFGCFLVVVFLVGIGIALAIRKVEPPDGFHLVHEAPQSLTICKRSSPSELFFLYAIVLVVETTTFSLLLWKVWKLSEVGVAPILGTMLKHGTHYYLVVFLALFVQVLGTVLQPLWQPMADALLVVPIASVACNRLILSLRGMYTVARQQTTTLDFHARSGTAGPTSRPVRMSTFRADRSTTNTSTAFESASNLHSQFDRELASPMFSSPPPIKEEESEGDDEGHRREMMRYPPRGRKTYSHPLHYSFTPSDLTPDESPSPHFPPVAR